MTDNGWSAIIHDLDKLLPEFNATLSQAELEVITKCLASMECEVDPAVKANWDHGSGSRLAKADTLQHLFPHLALLFAGATPGECTKKMDDLKREYKDWVETAQATILARKRLADTFGWVIIFLQVGFSTLMLTSSLDRSPTLEKVLASGQAFSERDTEAGQCIVAGRNVYNNSVLLLGATTMDLFPVEIVHLLLRNLFPPRLWHPCNISLGDLYSGITALVNLHHISRHYYDLCAYKALWSAIPQRLWGQAPAGDPRALCLLRLSVLARNPTLLVSQHISSEYTYSADINYIHSDFE
ncbi:hypothetical protein C8R46DRAFT_1219570 [Mycena filopes]|nr:hypothetical protein C8R46DRAFT_1219570 [Mycena filopes]